MKTKVELAELLLRRKELSAKVAVSANIKSNTLYDVRVQRTRVTDSLDEVTAQVPKVTLSQVTHEHDWHARQLRKVDAAIQKTNWETLVEIEEEALKDYICPAELLPR